jgi:DNA-binding MarR family transcriptional regulator
MRRRHLLARIPRGTDLGLIERGAQLLSFEWTETTPAESAGDAERPWCECLVAYDPDVGARDGEDVEWLTPEEQRHWRALIGLLMTLPPALDAQLKEDSGLNVFEYHVLAALSEEAARTLPMGRLARMSRGSVSRVSHAVSRLERAGWVRRVAGPGRRIDAELTPAGLAKVRSAAPGHVREVRRLVIDALTPEQLENLAVAARLVTATADPELAVLRGDLALPGC